MSTVLVLGGSRSGKSAFAEALVAGPEIVDPPIVDYVATAAAPPDDPEWSARIEQHRRRRPVGWRTLETGDAAGVLRDDGPPVLVDSITTWLARVMDECGCWSEAEPPGALAARVDDLAAAWSATPRFAVAVSDEVGLGIVPETASGRRFRDELGLLNQRLAAAADEVHLVMAGLPLRLR